MTLYDLFKPTDAKTATDRLEEITNEEYAGKHKLHILSVNNFDKNRI